MYTDILFDLDGTINESGNGIQDSFRKAMDECGYEIPKGTNLDFIIGPPLKKSFRKLGVPEEELDHIISVFRKHYKSEGIYINSVYPGMRELMERLKREGKRLYVATSKPAVMANVVVDYFDIRKYFEFVETSLCDEDNKTDVVRHAIGKIPSDKSNIVMVGDRQDDMEGARANGIASIGVLYGYGSREELENAHAGKIAESVEELGTLL